MEAIVQTAAGYSDVVARLNRASVAKHFDAYKDVPWEEPHAQLDPQDPRWELDENDPLGALEWYRLQPQAARARIGLGLLAHSMKRGVEFENILSRGLLEFALHRPNGSTDFRYAYHELIEEGQHSLMFQEFVNRSGCDVPALTGFHRFMARRVPDLGRRFPELFFVYVLAGEVPIDQTQRAMLRRGNELHPLLRKIMQIHVTEEARHVCFAEKYLATHVPQLSLARRLQLQWFAPFVAAETARLMFEPSREATRRLGIPRWVMGEVHVGQRHHARLREVVQPLYRTFAELGLVSDSTEPVWQLLGYGSSQAGRNLLPTARIPRLPK
ncbi:MAG: diiron oxygenase [Polyangiales bacterium]